jgi:hypothetical protein
MPHECALATDCAAPDRPVPCARRMAPRCVCSRADRRVGAWLSRPLHCGSHGHLVMRTADRPYVYAPVRFS